MRIERCGDRAFLIRLGDHPHPALSRRIATLRQRLLQAQPGGLDDAIAGFATLFIAYDPDVTTAAALADMARALIPGDENHERTRTWTLPVCYDASLAPDLAAVAQATGLTGDEVVTLHASRSYTVYLIGFSPGFPYMGDVDARLMLPRREDPRPRVPSGSVAIATQYTAIYPQDTAGGWHLIGRTPVRLFDARSASPALLQPGDNVRFRPIALAEYEALRQDVDAGAYVPQYVEGVA
ncbi:MAG: 5-oxoprolinase subunit PxpB [Rhodospirillaceae bacterium]